MRETPHNSSRTILLCHLSPVFIQKGFSALQGAKLVFFYLIRLKMGIINRCLPQIAVELVRKRIIICLCFMFLPTRYVVVSSRLFSFVSHRLSGQASWCSRTWNPCACQTGVAFFRYILCLSLAWGRAGCRMHSAGYSVSPDVAEDTALPVGWTACGFWTGAICSFQAIRGAM